MQHCLEHCQCPPLSLPVPVQGHVDWQAGGLQEVGDEVPADDAGLAGPHLPVGGGEVAHPASRTNREGGHLGCSEDYSFNLYKVFHKLLPSSGVLFNN